MAVTLVNPYCTRAEVREEIKNTEADSSLDDKIDRAINRASRWVENHLRRDFFQHDYTSTPLKIYRHDNLVFERVLFLPYRNVVSLTVVNEAGNVLVEGTDYNQMYDDERLEVVKLYRVDGSFAFPAFQGGWFCGELDAETIQLTGKFGYAQAATTDVPTGLPTKINLATCLVAAAFCGEDRKEVVGIDGNATEIADTAIPKTVFDMLGAKRPYLV